MQLAQGPLTAISRRNDAYVRRLQLRAAAGRDRHRAMPGRFLTAAFLLATTAAPALASSSDWHRAEGGDVRLVTTGTPDAQGILHGALQIELKPGWKTYWLDPGDAGVPPSIDVSASGNVVSAEMSFPAPHRFDDGFARWAGYKEPVSFPVAFRLSDPGAPAAIQASVFLGMCETICVPVQATLSLDAASDPDNADDAALVQAAVDALPGPEQPDFGVTLLEGGKDEVLVEAAFSGEPDAVDLFLAGSEGYQFGPPERRADGGRLLFSAPILQRPEKVPDKGALLYTLVTSGGAVTGMLPYPPAP
jgi:DsbC/DsbD-like thiol-disulfide interchange protein